MKVVHFVTDEKFIDSAIKLVDAVGGEHEFATFELTPPEKWKHVRQWQRVRQIRPGSPELEELLKREETLFVLHSRTDPMMNFCLRLKNRREHGNAILWLAWGFDYVYLIHSDFYGSKTLALLKEVTRPKRHRVLRLIATPLLKLRRTWRKRQEAHRLKAFLDCVDFYGQTLSAERDAFRSLFRKDAIEIPEGRWTYYLNPPQLPAPKPFTTFSADHPPRILLNHSAAWENNHADALCTIAPFLLPDQRITVPISYNAAAEVLRKALPTLPGGDRIDFLDKWLSLEAWWEQVAACDIFVQAARRQIANGAITAALAFGKKVYLSERNPFLPYYRELGVRIFSLEHDLGPTAFSTPLTPEEAERNIRIIKEKHATSRETNITEAKRFFAFIEAHMPQRTR